MSGSSLLLKRRSAVRLVPVLFAAMLLAAGCGDKKTDQPKDKAAVEGQSQAVPGQLQQPSMPQMVKTNAQPGDKVKVLYKGTLDDGTVFDESNPDTPLEFVIGSSEIIPGFSKGVTGMRLNEEKSIKIQVDDAYGKRDETLIRRFPKASLPKDMKVEKGMLLGLQDQSGRQVPGTVVDITESEVAIDMNHPLAGKALNFNLKLLSVE